MIWEAPDVPMSEVDFWVKKVQRDTEAHRRDYGKRKQRDSKIGTYCFYAGLLVLIAACWMAK